MKLLLFNLFLFSVLQGNAQKQDSSSIKKSVYLNLSVGFGGYKLASKPELLVQLSKSGALALSFQQTEKYQTMYYKSVPIRESRAWSIQYGKIIKREWGHFLLMAGPSMVKDNQYTYSNSSTPNDENHKTAFGVLLSTSIVPAYKWVGGIGTLFANINGAYTYGGVSIGMVLGKVNYSK